jgi:hypothetical protein
MRPKKMVAPAWKFGKELLLLSSVGGLGGIAVGFFMYLHLGPFKTPEDAGYAAGLFVKSGVQAGFMVWMIHLVVLGSAAGFSAHQRNCPETPFHPAILMKQGRGQATHHPIPQILNLAVRKTASLSSVTDCAYRKVRLILQGFSKAAVTMLHTLYW